MAENWLFKKELRITMEKEKIIETKICKNARAFAEQPENTPLSPVKLEI